MDGIKGMAAMFVIVLVACVLVYALRNRIPAL